MRRIKMAKEYAEFMTDVVNDFTDFLKNMDGYPFILKSELKKACREFLKQELTGESMAGRKLSIDEVEGVC